VRPGNGVYWKGVAHSGPDLETMAKVQEKCIEITKGGKFTVQVAYEWIPLQKINSVPVNATAYRRIPDPNCLVIVGWPGNTHSNEKVDEARPLAHQLAGCVAGGESKLQDVKNQGYANYGGSPLTLIKFKPIIHDIPDPEGILGDKDEDNARVAFGENYPALQKIKKKYDPENIFNKWFAITPA
jgi:FAD/FMN-containing dehydrogenase